VGLSFFNCLCSIPAEIWRVTEGNLVCTPTAVVWQWTEHILK